MNKLITLATLLAALATPAFSQLVTTDKMSPNSGCHTLYTYPSGFNLRISVQSGNPDTEVAIERTLALDISRFKDTGEVQTQHDKLLSEGQRPIHFDVTVFWAEVTVNAHVVGYVASAFITETCALFEADGHYGFSTQVLFVSGPYVDATKASLEETIEKRTYDALEATVKQRRTSAQAK